MWLSLAIVFEVIGTLTLKAATQQPSLYLVVAVSYVLAFGMLDRVLRGGMPIGVAYGLWGAIGVAFTALGSWLIYDEPLTPMTIAGIGVIIAGVLCIELGRQKS